MMNTSPGRLSLVVFALAGGCTSNTPSKDAGATCTTPAVLDTQLQPLSMSPCETAVVVAGTACPGHSVSISRDSCMGVPIISTVADSRGRFSASLIAHRGAQDFYAVDDQLPGSANCVASRYTLALQLSSPTHLDAVRLSPTNVRVTGNVDPSLAVDLTLSRDTSCVDDRNAVRVTLDGGQDGAFEVMLSVTSLDLTVSAQVESAGRCPSPCLTTDIHAPIPDAGVVDGG